MNSKTIEQLQYFVGKVCSIFTPPTCRQFDELRSREHFVVKVEEVSHDGVWGSHPYRKTISFFALTSILFIQEEQELDPNDPEHREMINEYEKKTGKKIVSDVSPKIAPKTQEQEPLEEIPASFVDVDALGLLMKQTKRSYLEHDIAKEAIFKKSNDDGQGYNLNQIQL